MIQLTEKDLKYILKECIGKLSEDIAYHGTDADFDEFNLDFVNTGAKSQVWGWGIYLSKGKKYANQYGKNLYTVEVPSDNGRNYIHAKEEIGERMAYTAQKELFNYFMENEPGTYPPDELRNELKCISPDSYGIDMYATIMSYLGSDKDTAKFCYEKLNLLGLRYNDNNTENIVMFNPKDIKMIKDNLAHNNLNSAKKNQNDEFYTQESDIEKELINYSSFFKGKTIYCNCDDPNKSNFFKFFVKHFNEFGLKHLYSTGYYDGKRGMMGEYDGKNISIKEMEGNGDFRSEESVKLLDVSDIVVTNPPFSLSKEIIPFLFEKGKYFCILGSINTITYKSVSPYIKSGKLWLGMKNINSNMSFKVPSEYESKSTRFWIDDNGQHWRSLGNVCWFTNIPIDKSENVKFINTRYEDKNYVKYDNFDAINVNVINSISYDYDGVIGTPIGVINFLHPDGLIHFRAPENKKEDTLYKIVNMRKGIDGKDLSINGKDTYNRILIQKVKG